MKDILLWIAIFLSVTLAIWAGVMTIKYSFAIKNLKFERNLNNYLEELNESRLNAIDRWRNDYIDTFKRKAQSQLFVEHTDDFNSLCRVIQAESENQSKEAQKLVAETVINKAIKQDAPISWIVFVSGQFASVSNGRINNCDGKGYESVAMAAIMNENRISAQYFCDRGISDWEFRQKFDKPIEKVKECGDMRFWKVSE